MTTQKPELVEAFNLGIIQTTLDYKVAWNAGSGAPRISAVEDNRAWHEIRRAMRALAARPGFFALIWSRFRSRTFS